MYISAERLALTCKLHALVVDYWNDVDTNWGRNAPNYYTPDGVFVGPAASYEGREKIRAFYKWKSEENTSELQSLMRLSYAVICLHKKKTTQIIHSQTRAQY